MERIESSVAIDNDREKEMQEISQCLKQIPILLDQNLTMINNLNFTFSAIKNQQNLNKSQEKEIIDQQRRNNIYLNMKKENFTKEMNLLNKINFYDLDLERLKSYESIQLDNQYELITFNQNQRKGFQNIQPNGLMSNQIFNNKFQQSILTGPHSSRNFELKDQSIFFTSSDPQHVEKNNKWLHKYPSYVIQKTENVEKSEYPTLFKNYSQIGKNNKDVSFEDQQIKQEFQTLINAKSHQQTDSSFNSINKSTKQQQQQYLQKQNEDLQKQQKVRRPSSPKFKFVVKQKKQTKTSGQHIKLIFEKGQKLFDASFQRSNKETSKSVDQLKINDRFIKLQNENERELYSKPFENTKYSEISKLLTCQTQESPIALLYKKKLTKSKQNISQNYTNSKNNLSNISDDNKSAQEFDDNFEDNQEQFIQKVDLQQLLKEKQNNHTNKNIDQNVGPYERNIFSFKQQTQVSVDDQFKQQGKQQNQLYYNQFQIEFAPQQSKQRFSPIISNEEELQFRHQYQNYNVQKYENQINDNFELSSQQFYEQKYSQFTEKKKQPIQIKLNIQQFVSNNNSEKQHNQTILSHPPKNVNQSNQYSQSIRTNKK